MKKTNLHGEPLDQMRQCVLFVDFTEDQFESVSRHTQAKVFNAGEILFEQGQKVTDFFLLCTGQVKLTRLTPDGQEKVIDIIHPGQTFAEAAMFLGHVGYPVNADALMPSMVIAIQTEPYLDILRSSADACFALMARMSRRLHWQVNEIDRLTLHNATFRVISYLLEHVPEDQIDKSDVALSAPKHVIASRLSIKPETLSRTFKRLTENNLIEVHDDHVQIIKLDKLREFVLKETGIPIAAFRPQARRE